MEGKIIKLLSGIYTVETLEGLYHCRAKGSFRKQGVSPVPGDRVKILALPDHTGRIDEILLRKNYLIRPNIANVDTLCYVSSFGRPTPFPYTIDKMLVITQSLGIQPVLIFNKTDLPDEEQVEELAKLYESLGYAVFRVSAANGKGMDELRDFLQNKTVVFAGNTGVGKSSILNALYPELTLDTGEISDKLGRGRHTTRHTELFPANGGFVADTPGFGALELEGYSINREKLATYFPEFIEPMEQCPYLDCAHMDERECGVKKAVDDGKIHPVRYENYRQIYQFLREDETPWAKKTNN